MESLVAQHDSAKRMAAFLGEKTDQDNKRRTRRYDKHHEPNVEHMRAIDHQLQSALGYGLAGFKVERQPGKLELNERRYFVPAGELPSSLALDGGHVRRCYVENTVTKQRRLEVVWSGVRRMLIDVVDAGSIGYPLRFWLGTKGGLRLVWFRDPCHLKNNRFNAAVADAGLKDVWQEAQVIFGLRKGPWSGAAHFAQINACAEQYFQEASHEDKLFRMCYPFIAQDLCEGHPPASAFTEPHMMDIWSWLPRCPLFHKHGAKPKRSRWFQANDQCESMRKYFGVLTLVLWRMGIQAQGDEQVFEHDLKYCFAFD